jgi:ribosomal protein S18 acetylase RimI-like enzyme
MKMVMIRQARTEDVARIKEIAVLAWSPIYVLREHLMGRQLFHMLHPDWKTVKSSEVESHFKKYPQWTIVLEEDDKVVGFLTYFLDQGKKIGEIGNNAIHPDYQGRGLGEIMYREAIKRFRDSGMLYAKVGTQLDDAHIPARAAYEKLGFRPITRSVIYYMKL